MNKAKRLKAVTYLVSGAGNISPSDQILRRSGRKVRYAKEVDGAAAAALRGRGPFVVVAHGRPDSTVLWSMSKADTGDAWLWVGMPKAPKGARLYLYSCFAGRGLPRFLKNCECLGHKNSVPMPIGVSRSVVLTFLGIVDRAMREPDWQPDTIRARLVGHIEKQITTIAEGGAIKGFAALLKLQQSLE